MKGFKISGWMPESHIFKHQVRSPKITADTLKAASSSFVDKVKQQLSLRQDDDLEAATWEETLHELEQGWVWQDDSGDWANKSVARRFGIRKNAKTRVIDDCTVSGLNMTVGTREKFHLHTVD